MQKRSFSFISITAAMLLSGSSLHAETMYEKFIKMQTQMQQLQQEVNELQEKNKMLEQKLDNSASVNNEVKEAEDEETEEEEEDDTTTDAKANDEEDEGVNKNDEDEDDDDEDDEDEEDPQETIADLQESVEELEKATGNNHLKFNVDYRFSVDNLGYKMGDGSTQKNNALLANRLWLNMSWAATDKLSFKGQLAYYKTFGHRSTSGYTPLDDFDWVVAENPYEGEIRVKNAYFFYHDNEFVGTPVSWTFSVGRRPSTNGHLINFRDDDQASSPNGHSINVEFDGASAKFGFDEWVQGMYIKFCAGRGLTNASSRFFAINPANNQITALNAPYADDPNALPNIDLGGFIFEPYSDGQYTFTTQYYYAANLIDAKITEQNQFQGFETVGNMHSFTASFIADGIGEEISDYLDDTIFFVSWAMSKSTPKRGKDMFHAPSSPHYGEHTRGYSVWTGLNMPSLISEEGKWGVEYNWGSKYWRSITYAEDTMIGSKVATRGSAYEVYFTEPLVDNILTAQLRFTYIDYEYTGSNGFFGSSTGASMKISDLPAAYKGMYVDKAQDIRFYLRYRY